MTKFKNVLGGAHNLAGIGYLRDSDVFEVNEVNAVHLRENAPGIYVEQPDDAEVTQGINKHTFAPEVAPVASPEPVTPVE